MKTIRSLIWAVALLAAVVPESAGAQAPSTNPVEARAKMKAVATRVEALVGVKGAERITALENAAADYEAIATEFVADKSVVEQSSWEAGECWRRAGKIDSAELAYGRALDTGGSRFRQRALFERASMLRRLKRLEEAGELYVEAGKIAPESVRAHDARLWAARILELRGEMPDAVAAYRSAVEVAVGPRRVIEASDALAKTLIRSGDLDGARAAIEHAEQVVADDVDGEGEEADRIRKALNSMGARGMLRRAVDKKTDAAGSAVDVENARGK